MFLYQYYIMSKGEINHVNSWDVNIEDTTPAMQQYLKIKNIPGGFFFGTEWEIFLETFF